MTVRATTRKGTNPGAYYVDALPNYYLDPGEPRGVWHGRGADLLGLRGEVDDGEFLRVMAGAHPRIRPGVWLGRAYGENSVRAFDVTASAPKSVSVLFAVGTPTTRAQVLEGHDAAVTAMVGWIEAHAHTRRRIGGQVAVVDAEGIVAATFRQHTSRALDPQVHTHVVIANRVRSDDGRWLALDARSLKLDQRTLSAIYHTTLRSELTRRLGVEWRDPVNGIAEITNIPERVLTEFSTRSTDIARRVDVKLDRFAETMGRDPTPQERWRLERKAVIDSRPAKAHDVDAAALHAEWVQRLHALGVDPVQLQRSAFGNLGPAAADDLDRAGVIHAAITVLEDRQSTWRPAEITRELAAALPPLNLPADQLVELLDGLTVEAIERRCVDLSRPFSDWATLRRDGRPVTESVLDRALTTPEILAEERWLLDWAERRSAHPGVDQPAAVARAERELSVPQAEAAAAVAGTRAVVMVIGPAGTGKTTALAPAVAHLHAQSRHVFGVAPSAAAAKVLAAETGVVADTIDKLLAEHERAAGPSPRYRLPYGTTILVDEAAMVPTPKLVALAELADTHGWRVALIGDPLQFSAVGRGGMFELLCESYGAIALDQVHRFTNPWERDASLRLRQGDTTVADLYDTHGRLHGGTPTRMRREAIAAWWDARRNGATVALSAPTNDTVITLNHAAQQRRINAGHLDTRGRTLDTGVYRIHVGDEIVTRENHRHLLTDQHHMIRNRDQFTVTQVHRAGDLTVTGNTGTVKLPAWYARDHVELAYAQTSHASQGRTVDRSILVLDSPCDVRGVYVPMTRGRETNDAYIVTHPEQTPVDLFADTIARNWIDQPAHTRARQLTVNLRPGTLPPETLRSLHGDAALLKGQIAQLTEDLKRLPGERDWLVGHTAELADRFEQSVTSLQKAFDTIERYDTPLRRRRHETDLTNARRSIEGFRPAVTNEAAELKNCEQRLADVQQRLDTTTRHAVDLPDMRSKLEHITDRLDTDAHIRTLQIRRQPSHDIIDRLGQRPHAGEPAKAWDLAAGRIDQHRTTWDQLGRRANHEPGHDHSYRLANQAINRLEQQLRPPTPQRHIEGPHLGISR